MANQNTLEKRTSRRPARYSASDGAGWQAEKSHLMRLHILDATMQCLVEIGYTQTTTEKIAKQAGVSRGAMTHHFKSRADVFAAAAEHITDIRAREYDEAIQAVTLKTGSFPTVESMRETLAALQAYYMKPSFLAFHELIRGARTNELLNDIMSPLESALDQRISASMMARFPVWADPDMKEAGEVLRDLIMHSLQGVALNPAPYLTGDRLHRLHELLARTALGQFDELLSKRESSLAIAK